MKRLSYAGTTIVAVLAMTGFASAVIGLMYRAGASTGWAAGSSSAALGAAGTSREQRPSFSMPIATISSGGVIFDNGSFAVIGQPLVGSISNDQYAMQVGIVPLLLLECLPPDFMKAEMGVSFSDRAWDGYIDPRRESDNGTDVNQGLDTITIEFTTDMQNADGAPISAAAFSISDTAGTPPSIVNVTSPDGGKTVTLELSDHITLQQWTTISFDGRSACGKEAFSGEIDIGYLPGDVNQNECVNPLDVTRYRQYINDVVDPDIGIEDDYTDCNRNGSTNALDLTCLRQLMFGTGPATKVWAGEELPSQP